MTLCEQAYAVVPPDSDSNIGTDFVEFVHDEGNNMENCKFSEKTLHNAQMPAPSELAWAGRGTKKTKQMLLNMTAR